MANLVYHAALGGLFVEHVVMLSQILKSWGEHSVKIANYDAFAVG